LISGWGGILILNPMLRTGLGVLDCLETQLLSNLGGENNRSAYPLPCSIGIFPKAVSHDACIWLQQGCRT